MLPTRRSSGMVTLLLKQAWQAARTDSPSAPTMLMSSGNLGALGVSQSEPHLFVSDWKGVLRARRAHLHALHRRPCRPLAAAQAEGAQQACRHSRVQQEDSTELFRCALD